MYKTTSTINEISESNENNNNNNNRLPMHDVSACVDVFVVVVVIGC